MLQYLQRVLEYMEKANRDETSEWQGSWSRAIDETKRIIKLSQSDMPDLYDLPKSGADFLVHLEQRDYLPKELLVELRSIPVPKAQKVRTVGWYDTWHALEEATGKSIVYEGQLERDPKAPASVLTWVKGYKALKPKARAIFQRVVKKIRLRSGRGSEDASWEGGGVMAFVVGKAITPEGAAFNITHELGHGVEEEMNVHVHEAPWGLPPFVSDYAAHKPLIEDFAESFRAYIMSPHGLSPEKFQALKQLIH
jgi:hypothetical protein